MLSVPSERAQLGRTIRTIGDVEEMRFSKLLILLLAAQIAFAQDPVSPPPVRIESVRASVRAGEVRIDIETSAPVEAPGAVMPYPDMLILDLPGVTQEGMGRRIQVNKADVRDVRAWMQQQKPPILRISVSMNRDKAYTLSAEGNRLTLRVGPGLQTAGARQKPPLAAVVHGHPCRARLAQCGGDGRCDFHTRSQAARDGDAPTTGDPFDRREQSRTIATDSN